MLSIQANTLLSILVVDDAESNRISLISILTRILKMSLPGTFSITEAIHGDDAVSKVIQKIEIDKKNYQLIFMDFNMPAEEELKYKDGQEATLGIRAVEKAFHLQPNEIGKIVTYTSSPRTAPFAGSDILLAKPCTRQNMEIVLENLSIID